MPGVYPYEPLKEREIRLLKIHAGTADDAIDTSLYHSSLNDGANYEALSYTWSKCIAKDAPDVDAETEIEIGLLNTNRQPNSVIGKPKVSKIKWKDLPHHEHSYLYYMMGGLRGDGPLKELHYSLLLIPPQNPNISCVVDATP
jgi:hypothetical protein